MRRGDPIPRERVTCPLERRFYRHYAEWNMVSRPAAGIHDPIPLPMNRRTFIKSAAVASAATVLRPSLARAALPAAKITKINFYEAPNVMPLQIPLLQSNMVVTIETDANLTGIGEGGTRDTLTPCAGRLIGRNPYQIEAIWQDMYRAFHYPPGRERLHAMGALDLALWDLKAKALDVPVYELLGGTVRNYFECYTTSFRGGGATLRDRAAACMDAGWRLFRFDAASVRGTNIYDARERMRQVQADCRAAREGVGPNGNFMVDFHQRFTLADAMRGCRMIEEFDPFAVEDPVETDSFLQDIPKLRQMTTIPIAAGEELGARWDFLPLVQNHDLDYIRRRTTSASCRISPGQLPRPRRCTRWRVSHSRWFSNTTTRPGPFLISTSS
jgi:galactonate dehydratase